MPALLPDVDPDGLLEYSVVYTDRALNHMSRSFQQTMRDLSDTLKQVYNARSAIVVPGSGTFGMEAVARQFATDRKTLVIRKRLVQLPLDPDLRNGADSLGKHRSESTTRAGNEPHSPFAPAPIDEVVEHHWLPNSPTWSSHRTWKPPPA